MSKFQKNFRQKLKKDLPIYIQKVKNSFEKLLKTKLIFSNDKTNTIITIINSINHAITSIDYTFSQFLKSKKSNSRVSSKRR